MENFRYNLGLNAAFPPKREDVFEYYKNIFNLMEKNAINICRIWLCDFSFNYYNFCKKEYKVNFEILKKVVEFGKTKNIKFIPVLFDFNEFSNTDVNWHDHEHTFKTSFIAKFVKSPIEFFDIINMELGLSKFLGLRNIFNESNVFSWELFNEVDQIEGYDQKVVLEWFKEYTGKIENFSTKPVYISFGNPSLINDVDNLLLRNKIAIHTYQWPYSNCYKNVIFWQSKYPQSWMMEFGNKDFIKKDILISLISSFLLNGKKKIAMPWFWDDVLRSNIYSEFLEFTEYINSLPESDHLFKFTGDLGATNNLFDSKKIKNSIKLAGIRNTFKKIKIFANVMLKNKSKNEKIKFDSASLGIVVQDRVIDNFDNMCNYKMLKRFNFGEINVAVFQK